MCAQASPTVEKVLEGLKTLAPFSYQAYKQGVKDLLSVDKDHWSSPCTSPVFGEDPGGNKSTVNRFKVETIALGVSRTSGYNFSDCVVQDGFADLIDRTASAMVVPVYRHYLEDHLSTSGNNLDILSLINDANFCQAFVTRVLDPAFINDALIARYFNQVEYVQAIAYIYERSRATLTSLPAKYAVYDASTGTNIPLATIALSSLPGVSIFARTAQANRKLSSVGQTQQFLANALPITWSDNQLLQGPSFPTLGAIWGVNWRSDTYATDVANALIRIETFQAHLTWSPPGHAGIPTNWVTNGDALWKWMEKQQNNGFADIFKVRGQENVHSVSLSFGSCFSPETVISTTSGDRPIHSLGANDKILTRAPKEFGILSDEKVQQDVTPVGFRNKRAFANLYGFNEQKPFVTGGHIFFTLAGPKAFQPEVARLENPRVHVGKLIEGDILLKLNKDETDYDRVEIKSIFCEVAKCSRVHGLHFARGGSGGGRYHANGYWVGENYPEITIQALQTRFKKMNHIEQHSFRHQVQSLPDSFEQVFGSCVYNSFQQNFAPSPQILTETPATDRLAAVEHAGASHFSVRDMNAHFKLIHAKNLKQDNFSLDTTSRNYKDLIEETNQHSVFPEISVSNGAVMVDGVLVKHASMSHLSVSWSHELPNQPGVFQHGIFRSIGHGKAITGYVGQGASDVTSLEDIKDVEPFFALADANEYELTASPDIYSTMAAAEAASPVPGHDWNTFWKVDIGIVHEDRGLNVKVTLPDLDAEWERLHPGTESLYNVSPCNLDHVNNILTIPIEATEGFEGYLQSTIDNWGNNDVKPGPAFKTFTILHNLLSDACHGYYTELVKVKDASDDYIEGPTHAIYSPDSYSSRALHLSTVDAITKSQLLGAPAKNASVHEPAANLHQPALPATQALRSQLFSSEDLSVADLQLTPAPTDKDMNAMAQKYMQNAASYWRLQSEVDVFGDEKKPMRDALPKSLTDDLYAGGQAFLGIYSRGMIMQSLSTQDQYAKRFSDADQDNLRYYWQGSQKGCVSQNSDFNKVTRIAASASFLDQTPGLEPYIKDSQDWANLFFAFLTTDKQITNQALAMFTSGPNNLTNRYCMILSALDTENRDYDVKLWKAVRDKLLMRLSTGKVSDSEEWPHFAEEFAKQLILQIRSGTTDLMTQLGIDLKHLEDTFNTKDAAKLAAMLYNASSELGRCFLLAFQEIRKVSSGGVAKLADLMKSVSPKVPSKFTKILPYVSGITAIVLQSYGIYISIKFLMNWGNLSDADRTNAILSIVNSVAIIFKDCASLVQRLRGLDPANFDYQASCVTWNTKVGKESPKAVDQEKGPDGETKTTPVLNEKQLAEVNQLAEGESLNEQLGKTVSDTEVIAKASKTFSLSEVVTGSLGVAANVASAVCIGFQIANDFQTGQPAGIKAMDILSEVITTAQVITGALEIGFVVVGVECAALPVVGAVVALIGVVLMLVETFVPRKPAENPVNKYLDNQKNGFFKPLPTQPQTVLTYDVTPKVPLNQQGTLTIKVTDPKKTNTLVKSLHVRFTAGSDATSLFVKPTGSDSKNNPTTNLVTYTIGGGRTDFTIAGGKTAAVTDNSMMAKISSSNAHGWAIGPNGLTITISGTVNSQAGTAKVKITEGTASRPDGIIASDVYRYFEVSKA